MGFSTELRRLRLERNILQSEIAEIIGTSRQQVSRLESGENEPKIEYLIKLADYFGCTIDYLVGRESEDGIIVIDGERVSQDVGPADKIYNQLNDRNKFRFLTYGQGLLDGQGK